MASTPSSLAVERISATRRSSSRSARIPNGRQVTPKRVRHGQPRAAAPVVYAQEAHGVLQTLPAASASPVDAIGERGGIQSPRSPEVGIASSAAAERSGRLARHGTGIQRGDARDWC